MPRRPLHPFGWLLAIAALGTIYAQAGHAQVVLSDDEQNFDLPAQPLGEAITVFASATHINIAVTSNTVKGMRSSPVHGRLTPQAALQRLLAGTGHTSAFTGPRSAVVYRVGASVPEGVTRGSAGTTMDLDLAEVRTAAPMRIGRRDLIIELDYARRTQSEIQNVLANDPNYRGKPLLLRVGIDTDAAGRITDVRVGRGKDELDRDRALPILLVGHKLKDAPPAGLIQPMWFDIIIGPPRAARQQASAQ